MLNFDVHRLGSRSWEFGVEVAVLLTESDVAEFDRMELHWFLNGSSLSNEKWQVCLKNFKIIMIYE